MEDPFILKFDGPRNGPSRPWETFPTFCEWCCLSVGEDASDGLLGVRACLAASGMIGLLGQHVQAATEPGSDPDVVRHWITNECGRLMMAVATMSEQWNGINYLRTLDGPCDQYVIRHNVAYGVPEEIPWSERSPIWMNVFLRIAAHILPIAYAFSMDAFAADSGFRPDAAAEEVLRGVHEIQTLLDGFDVTMSACLENQVRTCLSENLGAPVDDDT